MADGGLHEISVEIGKLTASMASMQQEVVSLKAEVRGLTELRHRGAGLLLGVGMVSSAVSALITWFLRG